MSGLSRRLNAVRQARKSTRCPQFEDAFALLLGTGCRPEEFCSVTAEDVRTDSQGKRGQIFDLVRLTSYTAKCRSQLPSDVLLYLTNDAVSVLLMPNRYVYEYNGHHDFG